MQTTKSNQAGERTHIDQIAKKWGIPEGVHVTKNPIRGISLAITVGQGTGFTRTVIYRLVTAKKRAARTLNDMYIIAGTIANQHVELAKQFPEQAKI